MSKLEARYYHAFWDKMRLRDYRDLDLGTAKDTGGYSLPTQSITRFRTELEKYNIFRQLATVITTVGQQKIKTITSGGEAAFVEKGGVIPENSGNEIASYTLNSYKIARIEKLSTEMINDAGFNVQTALADLFGKSFGRTEENGIINGNGENEPYGLLHSTKGAQIGVTAETLDFDKVKELFFSLDSQYRRSAVWVMSDETALQLRMLKDTSGFPLWNHNSDTILGKPVYTSPFMPDIGSGNKPVLFGDFSRYWFVIRGGLTLQLLSENYALNGMTGYLGMELVDGRLIIRDAVKALVMS
jgi:HK97 family phage major capsid protein